MSTVTGGTGCAPPIVPGPRSQTGRPCFPPGMHKRACTDTLEPKPARTAVEGADVVPRQPLLVWHDSQTAKQESRKLQLEWAKSGGKSATSSCISDPSESDGFDFNLTWPRRALLCHRTQWRMNHASVRFPPPTPPRPTRRASPAPSERMRCAGTAFGAPKAEEPHRTTRPAEELHRTHQPDVEIVGGRLCARA